MTGMVKLAFIVNEGLPDLYAEMQFNVVCFTNVWEGRWLTLRVKRRQADMLENY